MRNFTLILFGLFISLLPLAAQSSAIQVDNDIVPHQSSKFELVGDSIHGSSQYFYYTWDAQSKIWANSSLMYVAYSAFNEIMLEIKYTWDTDLQTWVENSRHEFTYVANVLSDEIVYNWQAGADSWQQVNTCNLNCFEGKTSAQLANNPIEEDTIPEDCPIR